MKCACGSGQEFNNCCEPFISNKVLPETAEQLMRSRYTAFTLNNIEYIQKTLAPESRHDFDLEETKQWAKQSKWKSLKILHTEKGQTHDKRGVVEFIATFEKDGQGIEHHEVSQFRKDPNGQWFFVDGEAHSHKEGEGHHHHHEPQKPVVREEPKVGRNDPCPCGSGKKFKKCHGSN